MEGQRSVAPRSTMWWHTAAIAGRSSDLFATNSIKLGPWCDGRKDQLSSPRCSVFGMETRIGMASKTLVTVEIEPCSSCGGAHTEHSDSNLTQEVFAVRSRRGHPALDTAQPCVLLAYWWFNIEEPLARCLDAKPRANYPHPPPQVPTPMPKIIHAMVTYRSSYSNPLRK